LIPRYFALQLVPGAVQSASVTHEQTPRTPSQRSPAALLAQSESL
jgi:hypothetical protein